MPSQILHHQLALGLQSSLSLPWKAEASDLYWGAQGPDIFYHNQRTFPSATFYGGRLHRSGLGTFCRHLTTLIRTVDSPVRERLQTFLLGVISHGVLDRTLHPYIIYHSGGRIPGQEETRKWEHCHPFLERILDVYFLTKHQGRLMEQDFDQEVLTQEAPPPGTFYEVLAQALWRTYPGAYYWEEAHQRVQNAFADARDFYQWTSFHHNDAYRRAAEMDRTTGSRRLALYHPHVLEPFDYLNLERREWKHPSTGLLSQDTVPQLFERALEISQDLAGFWIENLEDPQKDQELETRINNTSLNLSDAGGNPSGLNHTAPWDLPGVLDLQVRYWSRPFPD